MWIGSKELLNSEFRLNIRPLNHPLIRKKPHKLNVYKALQFIKVVPLGLEPRTT